MYRVILHRDADKDYRGFDARLKARTDRALNDIRLSPYHGPNIKKLKGKLSNLFYGEIEDLRGVWATGKTLEECRNNLKDVVEGWILLSIKKGLPIPNKQKINVDLLMRILRQAGITREEWIAKGKDEK